MDYYYEYKFGFGFKCLICVLLAVLSGDLTVVQCRDYAADLVSSTEPPSPSAAPTFKQKFQTYVLSILLGAVTGFVSAAIFACLLRCFAGYVKRAPILKGPVVFSPKISPKSLQSALANESAQFLGSNANGKYCRVVLENGLTVAVKRLEPFETGSPEAQRKAIKKRTQRELEILAALRHRNLMSLRAYVRESYKFCLVYDYVATGSLEDAMNRVRESQLHLSWDLRLRIALGVIKGLQYLHFSCNPRILHYNLKPSNVILNAEYEPRLGDCGLAKLVPNMERRASGYTPPECLQNLRAYTDKSDVYSFGAILGELLTGGEPTDPLFGETNLLGGGGSSLGRWLRLLQEAGDSREALDKTIRGEEMQEEDEMVMAVRITAVCLSDLPADRPSSDELVQMLTQLPSF